MTNTNPICDFLLRQSGRVQVTDLANKIFVQLGVVMCLAFGRVFWGSRGTFRMSTFLHHVRVVIRLCSEKQMVWSNAWWVVATMQNVQSIWYGPVMQLPRDTVCHQRFTVHSAFCDFSVAHLLFTPGSPYPATTRFIDSCPKALSEWHAPMGGKAPLTAVLSSAYLALVLCWVEHIGTMQTMCSKLWLSHDAPLKQIGQRPARVDRTLSASLFYRNPVARVTA